METGKAYQPMLTRLDLLSSRYGCSYFMRLPFRISCTQCVLTTVESVRVGVLSVASMRLLTSWRKWVPYLCSEATTSESWHLGYITGVTHLIDGVPQLLSISSLVVFLEHCVDGTLSGARTGMTVFHFLPSSPWQQQAWPEYMIHTFFEGKLRMPFFLIIGNAEDSLGELLP